MNIKEALCYESFLFYTAVIFLPFFLAMLTMVVKGIVSFVFFIRMMPQECFLGFAGNM
jgi:hypothetical protein